MTKLKIDYSEARDWYIKGDKDKEGIKYPSLPDIEVMRGLLNHRK